MQSQSEIAPQVYLCYDGRDREAVENILSALRGKYDVYNGFAPGAPKQGPGDEELTGVGAAKAVVVVWSSHSIDSDWVSEISARASEGSKLIGVLIDGIAPPSQVTYEALVEISLSDTEQAERVLKELVQMTGEVIERQSRKSSKEVNTKASKKAKSRSTDNDTDSSLAEIPFRKEFLALLNNKAKHDSKESFPPWTPRPDGFVLLVADEPDLAAYEELCQQQAYNTCYTFRLQTQYSGVLEDTFKEFDAIFDNSASVEQLLSRHDISLKPSREAWEKKFAERTGIETGDRAIVFIEITGVPDELTADDRSFLAAELAKAEKTLTPRVGIVVAGLPEGDLPPTLPAGVFTFPPPLERKAEKHSAPWLNDAPTGEDELNIKQEAFAIAEAVALNKMSPPLVIGVLGGWGAGKSFVLDLIKRRLMQIRCDGITDPERYIYVGHPYIVEFNAWTYAKSNLWASLMHDIFVSLNNQLTAESALLKHGRLSPIAKDDKWETIYRVDSECLKLYLEHEAGVQALEEWINDRGEGKSLWKHFCALQSEELKELKALDAEIARVDVDVRQKQEQVELELQEELDKKAHEVSVASAILRFAGDTQKDFVECIQTRFKNEGVDLPSTASEFIKESSAWKDLAADARKSPRALLLIVALTVVVGVIEWLSGAVSQLFSAPQLDIWVKAVAPSVALASQALNVVVKWSRKVRRLIESAKGQLDVARSEVRKTHTPQLRKELSVKHGLDEATELSKTLHEQRHQKQQRLGPLAEFTGVHDFVKSRLNEKDYEDELGLLHRAQRDLRDLSSALSTTDDSLCDLNVEQRQSFFPRGDSRVFLIIDDVDRCPPDRVVEILEAAQLLVKTNLFVVILAMDVRYVTRALEKHYKDILVRSGDPSGLDYIEKIIQVPYRVRPMRPDTVGSYLESQMGELTDPDEPASTVASKRVIDGEGDGRGSGAGVGGAGKTVGGKAGKQKQPSGKKRKARPAPEPLPPEALHFSTPEHKALDGLCRLVDITPRSAKRLVNVFKLMKIVWQRRTGPEPTLEQKTVMLLLLTLSARYPEVMRHVLREIDRALRLWALSNIGDAAATKGKLSPAAPELTIKSVIEKETASEAAAHDHPADWRRVNSILTEAKVAAAEYNLHDLTVEDIHLVTSFSFVGEVDPQTVNVRPHEPLPKESPKA